MSSLLSRGLIFLFLLVLACSCACSASESDHNPRVQSRASNDRPQITEEKIRQRIVGEFVRDVPEENNAAQPIDWSFLENEPKEFTVVEQQTDGDRATVVIDMRTGTSPLARDQRRLAGRLRLHWQLQTGWVMRRWEIVEVENISMKYKNQ